MTQQSLEPQTVAEDAGEGTRVPAGTGATRRRGASSPPGGDARGARDPGTSASSRHVYLPARRAPRSVRDQRQNANISATRPARINTKYFCSVIPTSSMNSVILGSFAFNWV